MTIDEWLERYGVTAVADRAEHNPEGDPAGDEDVGRRHWLVTLFAAPGRSLVVPFTQGSAWTTDPTAAEVLDCLAQDCASVEDAQSFGDWAMSLGYDPDSRKAEALYRRVLSQREELQALLTDESFHNLLWETERR